MRTGLDCWARGLDRAEPAWKALPRSQPAACARTAMGANGGSAPPHKGSCVRKQEFFDHRCTQMHADSITYLRASASICGRLFLLSDRPLECGGLFSWQTPEDHCGPPRSKKFSVRWLGLANAAAQASKQVFNTESTERHGGARRNSKVLRAKRSNGVADRHIRRRNTLSRMSLGRMPQSKRGRLSVDLRGSPCSPCWSLACWDGHRFCDGAAAVVGTAPAGPPWSSEDLCVPCGKALLVCGPPGAANTRRGVAAAARWP
jgi:hypothetical protein